MTLLRPPFYAGRAKAHYGSYALNLTFTLNEEAAKYGLTGACSVSASLQENKVSLQVYGNNAGSEPWRILRGSMEKKGLEPLPAMSPTILFTRAAGKPPSLDVSKLSENITKYLKVTVMPVGGGGGEGGGAPPAALQP